VCQDREHKLCSLLSYCATPQPLCSVSCGGKCARKWHLHSSSHTCQHALRQRALTPPHAAPKRLPACPLSSLAPCQKRPPRPADTVAEPNCREKLFYPGAAHGERVRPRGVRQTCHTVLHRARPPLGRTCKVRPRPNFADARAMLAFAPNDHSTQRPGRCSPTNGSSRRKKNRVSCASFFPLISANP